MAKHWVKATSVINRTDAQGHHVRVQPGDWFECKTMERNLLYSQRQIEVPGFNKSTILGVFDLADCGVVVTSGDLERGKTLIVGSFAAMPVTAGFDLQYARTLLWNTQTQLRLDLMPVGFHRLTTGWQIAAPIWRYQKLASDIGDPEDQRITAEMIHDLRVPVYETGCVYVRRCPDTERFMDAWKEERTRGKSDKLAFMRALYRTKLVMNALPLTWMQGLRA